MNTTYEYIDEESTNHELICTICQSPFKDPYCTPCDETFCLECIKQWILTQNGSCPICRTPLSVSNLKQATRVVRNMLDQLQVKCLACQQTNLQRGNFNDHVQKVCPKTLVECPLKNEKCQWIGERERLDQHLVDCRYYLKQTTTEQSYSKNRKKKNWINQVVTRTIGQFNWFTSHRQTNIPNETTDSAIVCSISGCNDRINLHSCYHCRQLFCTNHMIPHDQQIAFQYSDQTPQPYHEQTTLQRPINQQNNRSSAQPSRIDVHRNSRIDWRIILILSILGYIVIYRIFNRNSLTESIVDVTDLLATDAIAIPVSCSSKSNCPWRNVTFEDSYLLNHEHQNYLNYFYNDTKSRVSRWQLIYRGTKDGLNASSFHTHCDNKGETFTILSTTEGYLFGGYTDINWETSSNHSPTYGQSLNAFIFTLSNPKKTPARKFLIDARYQEYAIVNDVLSGPIFGGMSKPDIGTYDFDGQFRCQIHFPTLYKGAIGISSFPSSHSCVINEVEVFVPVFKIPSFVQSYILRTIFSLLITFVSFVFFCIIIVNYNLHKPREGRQLSCIFIFIIWINYLCGQLRLLALLLSIIVIKEWNQPNSYTDMDIRNEKQIVMVFFFMLCVCL